MNTLIPIAAQATAPEQDTSASDHLVEPCIRTISPPIEFGRPMTHTLNVVSAALNVHPRTILRMTTGFPNPYWADGYDPDVDLAMVAALVGSSMASIERLISGDDQALNIREAAAIWRITPHAFYQREIVPNWQIGRVRRYSLIRLGKIKLHG